MSAFFWGLSCQVGNKQHTCTFLGFHNFALDWLRLHPAGLEPPQVGLQCGVLDSGPGSCAEYLPALRGKAAAAVKLTWQLPVLEGIPVAVRSNVHGR